MTCLSAKFEVIWTIKSRVIGQFSIMFLKGKWAGGHVLALHGCHNIMYGDYINFQQL